MKRMLTFQELQDLEALLPPGQVLWGESIGPDWTHDELSGVSGMPGGRGPRPGRRTGIRGDALLQ